MENRTILEVLQERGISVDAVCSGNHSCGKCIVRILNRTPEVTDTEQRLLSAKELEQSVRLACEQFYEEGDEIVPLHQEMMILDELKKMENISESAEGEIGLIADIGTTTAVMKWIDCGTGNEVHSVSFMNPQRSYGADVIARIKAYGTEGERLHTVLVNRMEQEILSAGYEVSRMVIAGNTVMTYLFFNEDPSELGVYPFRVSMKGIQKRMSSAVFTKIPYTFEIIAFPAISAFVGGDITAGIYALDLDRTEEAVLFMDLGTNGEMAVCAEGRITVTSTAAGPAFEGAGIACGGGSVPGAVTSVRLNPLKLTTILNEAPSCICGSGIVSLTAELVRNEMVSANGRLQNGTVSLGHGLTFSQKDMQNIQMAKAAVQAGVSILRRDTEIREVRIAGGLGKGIAAEDLVTIGILPEEVYSEAVGNTSLEGCRKLLLSEAYERITSIAENAVSRNLADEDDFEDELIDALYFFEE